MLPVGVGSGAVVLSKGRVVGGIRVTLPLEKESVMFVVAVMTRVLGVSDAAGGGVVVSTGTVSVDVVERSVERDTVSTSVVLVLGVSIAVVTFDEGVANPLEAVEFEVVVAGGRLKEPERSPSLLVNTGPVEVALVDAGGITPLPPVEIVKAVSPPVEKLPTPLAEKPPVGVGMGNVELTTSVITSVPLGGTNPDALVLFAMAMVEERVNEPERSPSLLVNIGPVEVALVDAGGITPEPPVLFVVAVAMILVKLLTPVAVVMTSVMTVGVRIPPLPVALKVAIEVAVVRDPLPESVVLLISTVRVSDETAVLRIGVSMPADPVDVMVKIELETTITLLVFGP